jgi:hypothetical protein
MRHARCDYYLNTASARLPAAAQAVYIAYEYMALRPFFACWSRPRDAGGVVLMMVLLLLLLHG